MKKLFTLLSILLIILSAIIMPLHASQNECLHTNTTTENTSPQYSAPYNANYHAAIVYEVTICTECFQIINSVVAPGYPMLVPHTNDIISSASQGYHTGHYSRHYYFHYYDCPLCGYHFQERRLIGCTAAACIEPGI